MDIDKIGQKAIEAYVQRTQAAAEKAPPSTGREASKSEQDQVSISQAARGMQEAREAVQNAPDVREAKVAALRKQVQEGTYSVPTEALVDKLLSALQGD